VGSLWSSKQIICSLDMQTRQNRCQNLNHALAAFSVGAHPGLLLDAPQWPSESTQGYHLLFFRFAQDVAHTDEGYCLTSESTSPSLILVGRFSGDPHWPVLGDR